MPCLSRPDNIVECPHVLEYDAVTDAGYLYLRNLRMRFSITVWYESRVVLTPNVAIQLAWSTKLTKWLEKPLDVISYPPGP